MMDKHFAFSWILKLVEKELSSNDYEKFEKALPDDLLLVWEHACSALAIPMSNLAEKIAETFSLSLAELPINKLELSDLPDEVLEKYKVVPLQEDERQVVFASAFPIDQEAFSILSFLTDKHVEFAISTPIEINEWLAKNITHQTIESTNTNEPVTIKSSVIVRLVDKLIEQALKEHASDIHIEPHAGEGIVRFRIDGLLHKVITFPWPVLKHVCQRIKAISRLDVSNSLVPQDGQIHIKTNNGALDLRVSTIPVKGGEKFVLRLLKSYAVKSLEQQNFLSRELQQLKELMTQKKGVLVMSGPTGSGKTTTLNSAIQEINTIDKCIITVEDPVEYEIEGVAQIDVNVAQGVTFDKALRHILRQDPDVILVGEVRDSETAEIAIRAALTGHLVLTTLHTNDAITVIPRLKDLGISNALMADSLKGLAAQRLIRKLCSSCAITIQLPETKLEQEFTRITGKAPKMRAHGCEACNNTGFKGRIPLLEIFIVDDVIADAIRNGSSTKQLTELAKQQGMRSLSETAVEHILNGSATVEEAFRILGKDLWTDTSK
jgi:type II secretory ATPase GspE/PulE/Tfp pilus assembly ATPase PilB-like protein